MPREICFQLVEKDYQCHICYRASWNTACLAYHFLGSQNNIYNIFEMFQELLSLAISHNFTPRFLVTNIESIF